MSLERPAVSRRAQPQPTVYRSPPSSVELRAISCNVSATRPSDYSYYDNPICGDPEEPISFRGQGATECEDFINMVNRSAWSAGKTDDSKWIAGFAMSCFAGKALRWSMQLDNAIRADWTLLSRALLLKYTDDEGDDYPASRYAVSMMQT